MSIQQKIEEKLKNAFSDAFIKVTNESFMHSVPKGSETHFRIEIVSLAFAGKTLLNRHRFVQEILREEFALIKAHTLHTLTPEEWEKAQGTLPKTPGCVGAKNPN